MDVRRLRVLREVGLKGSFSAAAESLSFTPSAVSQQIALLEREAGTVLVDRGARGARLTAAGKVLVRHTESVLAQLAAARAELGDLADLRAGELALASFASAWSMLIPRSIARFRDAHPDIQLELVDAEPTESVAKLVAGEVDLAVVFEPNMAPQYDDRLDKTKLLADPLYAALPADHRLSRRRQLRLAELAEEAWVQPTQACATLVRKACASAGFEPRVAFESDDYQAIQGFVAAGVGVALIPALALFPPHEGVIVRPLVSGPARQISVLSAPAGYRSIAATAMIETLQQVAAAWTQETASNGASAVRRRSKSRPADGRVGVAR
jgi:DNA-binding transcriptional LysR family regulator